MTDFIDGDDAVEGDPFDPKVAQEIEDAHYETNAELSDAAVEHLRQCKVSYTKLFNGQATAFDVDFVMRDLAWFCNAYDAQWSSDARQQDRNVARREVYQRIVEYTCLDNETLVRRYFETQRG